MANSKAMPVLAVFFDKDPVYCDEFRQLLATCGFEVRAELWGTRAVSSQYYVSKAKMEELRRAAHSHKARALLFDAALSPTQERNLSRALRARVMDRVAVILDIFALHAHTFEAKLQVRRARLAHMRTRLVRTWTHLERQRGGIGVRGGPGEAQLESDRRKLQQECRALDKRLERVRSVRQLGRARRQRTRTPMVVLVGRTNAGKSTLFNALSGARAHVADQLFATLGTTLRRTCCAGVQLVLADTVGFIRRLPHELIESFHASLEEVCSADLLLQLTDISSDGWHGDESDVDSVLARIGASDVPRLRVYTKIDLLAADPPASAYRNQHGELERVYLSAQADAGLDLLRSAVAERLRGAIRRRTVSIGPEQGALQARLHRLGVVISEHGDPCGGWRMDIALPKEEWNRLSNRYLL